MGCCVSVPYSQVGILEKWGDYQGMADPGCHCLNCCGGVRLRDLVNLRVQQLGVKCDTKTSDDVTLVIEATVQYQVQKNNANNAYYSLDSPGSQIKAYVLNSVRSSVPRMTLDEVYANKDNIANHVKEELEETMGRYGFTIISTLITDITPDAKVAQAMNEINAAKRLRIAATDKAEADKILTVKTAEGDAESKFLSGQGIARQRRAIIDGLKDSVMEFSQSVPGSSAKDVMQLVMMTQYFDTMKDIAADSRTKTIFIPYSPNSVNAISEQISAGIMQGNEVAPPVRMEQ